MGKTSARNESNADLKFQRKLEFYSKIRDTAASLSAHKAISKKKKKVRSRQKKLKAYDLSSLSELLPELKERKLATDEFKLNGKSRHKLILKEAEKLRTVLNHPAFQSDPLGAIHQHLQSMQPVVEEKPKKKSSKNGSKKSRERKLKASAGVQSMEMESVI